MDNFFYLFTALLLVFLNGFFVAAEFGMVRIRHTRVSIIKQLYGYRGKILADVHHSLDAYLSACQLGITLTSLGLGWIGEPAVAYFIEPIIHLIGFQSPELIGILSFTIAFSILSFLHIVLGELVPKSLAIREAELISVWTAVPLYLFYWLMYPAIWFLNYCANAILKLLLPKRINMDDQTYTSEEIKLILSASHTHGELTRQEIEILQHTLDFADLNVTAVMKPVDEIISIRLDQANADIAAMMMEHRYSRYPVLDPVTRQYVGIIHIKDFFVLWNKSDRDKIQLNSIVRPILKVSAHLPAIELLNYFKEGKPHFALIFSGRNPIGFLTLDNLLQIFVGRIRDEFHKTDEPWKIAEDGGVIIDGNCSLYTIERALGIHIKNADKNVSGTLFGQLLARLGRLPQVKERIEFDKFTVVIAKMKKHRIEKVILYAKKKPTKK